ncbi:methylated-DNA--[protein]-cysteine S-methyltransferase [Thermogutta sp.]|uniref:methylated-DNA--[protein]-cysteine S-methyltransferase n=1 Tax=Thermogutta sp. TaxID=1962930 RepID=UPI00321F73F4
MQTECQFLCCESFLGWFGFAFNAKHVICGCLGAATATELLNELRAKAADLCVSAGPVEWAALTSFVERLHARMSPRESRTFPASRFYVLDPRFPPSPAVDNLTDLSTSQRQLPNQLTSLLQEYLAGRPVEFSSIPVDLSRCSPFVRRVLEACRSIPYGETRSYKQLAESVGHPLASRAVGQALGRNPVPLLIPCHRVISTSGRLCGFTARGGLAIKARLLKWEAQHRPYGQSLPPRSPNSPATWNEKS